MKTIIYDFDGTLTPSPIPKYEILEKYNITNELINKKIINIIKNDNINDDEYIKLYQTIIKLFKEKNIELTYDIIILGSNKIQYNKNVNEFLKYLNQCNINNYIISSGIKSYLENTTIAKYFNKIYATTFNYQDNIISNIKYLMNDKNKINAIKDIIKNDNINIKDIIYIGDGLSDYYAFKYIYENNGTTILLNKNADNKIKKFATLTTEPDYSFDKELFKYIKNTCNIQD